MDTFETYQGGNEQRPVASTRQAVEHLMCVEDGRFCWRVLGCVGEAAAAESAARS
jgi:hypothetical protein